MTRKRQRKAYRFDGGQVPGRLGLVVALEGKVIVETVKGGGFECGGCEVEWVHRLKREGAVGGDEQCGAGGEWGHMTEAMVEGAEGHC